MSEHGFLRPNPVLFQLETLRPKPGLGHELGQGAACGHCGDKCAGFELHFWKKVRGNNILPLKDTAHINKLIIHEPKWP